MLISNLVWMSAADCPSTNYVIDKGQDWPGFDLQPVKVGDCPSNEYVIERV